MRNLLVDRVAFQPLHKNSAGIKTGLGDCIKVAREELAGPAHPKIWGLRKDHIPFFVAPAQDAKSVAEPDVETRIVLDGVGSVGEKRQHGADFGQKFSDDNLPELGPKRQFGGRDSGAEPDEKRALAVLREHRAEMREESQSFAIRVGTRVRFAVNVNGTI